MRRAWPRRTIWPTRDGWWCLAAATGLGLAAMSARNNLLYLLASMLLGLIVVSGIFSEQSLRRVRLRLAPPPEIFAGRPALFTAVLVNTKRWRASYSVSLETAEPARLLAHVPWLAAGGEQPLSWETTLPRRGRQALPTIRLTTRFPFGLFVKTGHLAVEEPVIVFPAVRPLAPAERRRVEGGGATAPRRGRGHDLHNLREYRPGDELRLVHWRASAKTPTLLVRELLAEDAQDTRIVLVGTGARDAARLERGLSEAASLAVHLVGAGGAVGLDGPGLHVAPGRGPAHARRLLTALALYEPGTPAARLAVPAAEPPPRRTGGLSEIRVALG